MTPSDKFMQEATLTAPQCHQCAHWIKDTLTCLAFPEGIPTGILTNEVEHTQPVPGDHGVMFTLL